MVTETTKKPIALCFFEDDLHSAAYYADREEMKKKDIFVHLKESPMNLDIAKHVLDVSVTRTADGNINAAISVDNEASRYTTKLFNAVFAAYSNPGATTKATVISEGLGVVIYMGYYTGKGDWSHIVKRVEGVITRVSFSFQQGGTPQFVLELEDVYTFMGNSKSKNSEMTMQEAGGVDNPLPLRNAFPYTSAANRTEVNLVTGYQYTVGSAGEAGVSSKSATGNQDKDTAKAGVSKKTTAAKKKEVKFRTATILKKYNIFSDNPGLRDSQAVLQIADRYNRMIDRMYPSPEMSNFSKALGQYVPMSADAFALKNKMMRDKLKIKNAFVLCG